ncbi:MAG: hypothetical protein AAF433_04540 [Bacteroidota bacterium]
MKIVYLCSALLLSAQLVGQSIAVESFDYSAALPLNGQGEAGGGWLAAWELISGEGSAATVAGEVVEMPVVGRSTTSQCAQLENPAFSPLRLQRLLANPHRPADGVLWLGFAAEASLEDLTADAALGLIDLSREDFRALRFSLGKNYEQFNAVADGVAQYPRDLQTGFSTGQWLVAALYPSETGNWLAYAWANPDPTMVPDTSTAALRAMPIEAQQFDGIWLSSTAGPGLSWRVDDIRLGTDFAAIVPPDWEPFTGDSSRVAHEPFSYPSGEILTGQFGGQGFSGEWERITGPTHTITSATLNPLDTFVTQPNLLDIDLEPGQSGVRYLRRLAFPYSSNQSEYWLAANLDINFNTGSNVAQIFLANSSQLGPGGPAGQLLQIGKAFQIGQLTIGVPGNYANSGVGVFGTHFVVVRIIINSNTMVGQYDLWINPDPYRIPLDADILATIDLPLQSSGWDALGIKVEGTPTAQFQVDDFAYGFDYFSVVPPYWTENPSSSTTVLAGLENFALSPNPSLGTLPSLGFELIKPLALQCYLVDQNGRILLREELGHLAVGSHDISLPDSLQQLPAGTYEIRLVAPQGQSGLRWIKTQ